MRGTAMGSSRRSECASPQWKAWPADNLHPLGPRSWSILSEPSNCTKRHKHVFEQRWLPSCRTHRFLRHWIHQRCGNVAHTVLNISVQQRSCENCHTKCTILHSTDLLVTAQPGEHTNASSQHSRWTCPKWHDHKSVNIENDFLANFRMQNPALQAVGCKPALGFDQ